MCISYVGENQILNLVTRKKVFLGGQGLRP